MRYSALTDLGGFFWWLLIRHTKTTLNEEKTKEKCEAALAFAISFHATSVQRRWSS